MDISYLILALLACVFLVQLLSLLKRPDSSFPLVLGNLDALTKSHERLERILRDDLQDSRQEARELAKENREELLKILSQFHEAVLKGIVTLGDGQRNEIVNLRESNEKRLEALRLALDERIKHLQDDNAKQLEKMRVTVDEKLQGTLEKRLGESFKQVSERLELVHKGLGEMQTLATGVGDLKRVLTNVKTRGGWGEVQLSMILSEILSPSQYAENVKVKPQSSELVEFAIRMPGRGSEVDESVWLPVDSKFPMEDYQRLVEAHEVGDLQGIDDASKMLEASIKKCAKDICTKYVHPPYSTDFGIMFLPVEGLYAEVARRRGLLETLQREFRVVVSGPTTFVALLNSLQMGFKTLAIEKRSSEVWEVLGAVKSEFGKFGAVLETVKTKLSQAVNSMDSVATRSRQIERKLKNVESLPEAIGNEQAENKPGLALEGAFDTDEIAGNS